MCQNIGGVKIKDARQNRQFQSGTKPRTLKTLTQPAILKTRQKRRFVIIEVTSLGLSPKEITMKLKYHYTKQSILIFAA